MSSALTLSRQLQEYIADTQSDYENELSAEEKTEQASVEKFANAVVLYVIYSREMLSSVTVEGFEDLIRGARELVASSLNEHYTKTFLTEIDAFVERTLELSRLRAERTPSPTTNTYLREATRTYIYGLPLACVALTRAALEQSLKEVLGYQLTGVFLTFQDLVDEAQKYNVLDRQTSRMARSLAKEGDTVLHDKPTDLKKASEVLIGVRGLVQQIYSSQGGY